LLKFYIQPLMQQPTLDSVMASLPSARDIPFLSKQQVKQYYFVARNLIDQILARVPHLRDPRSRTINNLRAILEESFGNSVGICSGIEKQRKKLTRFKKSDRRAELIKEDNAAYSLLQAKIINYITIKNLLHQLAMNHFSIIKLFPDYGLQATPRYVQGHQNFTLQSNFLLRNYEGEILMALDRIQPPACNTPGQAAIVPSLSHLLIE